MSTLYERLLEICRDQGIESPKGRDIQTLTGLSSGRVTQIKQGGSAARLSGEPIQRLNRLGYLADWIQEGRGTKRLQDKQADGESFVLPLSVRDPAARLTAQIDTLRRTLHAIACEFGVSIHDLVSDSAEARHRVTVALESQDDIEVDAGGSVEPGEARPMARPSMIEASESFPGEVDPAADVGEVESAKGHQERRA